ncbi:MAG: carbon monoxide dehydrogenase subunit G [Anaerolineales bacterium]|nr:carbon monoxide dehydrogenase subunit G [Anaerolineales bacterium]
MKVQGTYTFAAPREIVWPMIQDPHILTNVMPGCEQLEEIGENQFQGMLKIKVGPVQGTFKGTITLSDITDSESYNVLVNGKGAPGFVKGSGHLKLEGDGDTTILHYDGDAQVGGRLASVGQRLLDSSAKAIIRQSLEGLGHQIQARMMADAMPDFAESEAMPEAAHAPAPSQLAFATGVAKNMFEEMVPPEEREAFFTKVVLVLAGVLLFRIVTNWFINRLAKKVAKQIQQQTS